MNTSVIPVESRDTFEIIKRKIIQYPAKRVLLVLPDYQFSSSLDDRRKQKPVRGKLRARPDYRLVDFRLLDRFCSKMGCSLGLVTRDEKWLLLARELSIPAFDNLISADEDDWVVPQKNNLAARERRKKTDLIRHRKTYKKPILFLENSIYWRWAIFLVGFIAVLSVAGLFIPSASIILELKAQTQSLQMTVKANPDTSYIQLSGELPAYTLSVLVEGEDEINSTGTIVLADQPASGKVVFTNLTDQMISVPAGTRVLTSGDTPVVFLTMQPVDVTPEEEDGIEVPVQALLPGSEGNVPAGSIQAFVDQMGLSLTVTNPEAMTGGSDRGGPIPTDQDVNIIKEKILSNLERQAAEKLELMLQDGQILIDESVRLTSIVKETRTPQVGEPGEVLRYHIQAEYSAWIVHDSDIESLANSVLDASLEDGYSILPGTLTITTLSKPLIGSDNAEWEIEVNRKVKPSKAVLDLRSIANKKVSDAVQIIKTSNDLQSPPVINVRPVWWWRMPFLDSRMELILQ